jgi:NAD(P)-dependent dehydrogenase (short-subunit alcohol dehydrogenase family)
MSSLRGRRVLVTGPARGIGEAVARELVARGCRVGLVGLERERLSALAEDLGPAHAWSQADVTDQPALERAVATVAGALGGLDAVVSNAGVANRGTVATSSADALARVVEVNLVGTMRTVSATLPHLLASRGHFLLVASAASFTVSPGLSAYCASKAGVHAFGDALRLEVAHRGVTVGTAHPIWIDTDLVRDARQDLPLFARTLDRTPGPWGRPLDVESCARYLVDGLERRSDKVFVPPSVRWLYRARTVIQSRPVRRLFAREAARAVPELEAEVRQLGRAFGRHTVAVPPD